MIAANEATCIYVLPRVFSEYNRRFPNVQIVVDRSYGAHVVEAVVDNQADFGITQLPVEEKRLQVVKIHSDEIKLVVPPDHPFAREAAGAPGGFNRPALAHAESRRYAQPSSCLARAGRGRDPGLDGAGFDRNDQALCHGRAGRRVRCRCALPRRNCDGPAGGDFSRTRSHRAPDWFNL